MPYARVLFSALLACGSVCATGVAAAQSDGGARAVLVDGLGIYSRPISTNSVEAQQFFDQGLNLTVGYYFVHAAASFQEAIRHDPDSPMLYWGLALAVGPNPNSRYLRLPDDPAGEGKRAIDRAMDLRNSATAVERDLIESLYVRYDDKTYPDRDNRGRWDELEAESPPPEEFPYLQGMWRYVQGSRYVHEGNLGAADSALAELRAYQSHPDIREFPIRANPGAATLEIAAQGLAGEIALARNDFDSAIDHFLQAVRKEDALGYIEPPDWSQSMRLYLGNAYLEASRPGLAEATFRDDLERFPENGWALFGLWQSLEAQGEVEEARSARGRFEAAWQFADTMLDAPVF